MDETVQADEGERVLDIASRAGIDISNLCGGEGVCGRCRVQVRRGAVNFSTKHLAFLDKKDLEEGYVLACQSRVRGEDVEVRVPSESVIEEEQVLTFDRILAFETPTPLPRRAAPPKIPYFQPLCRKMYLELPQPTLSDSLSDLDRIYRAIQKRMPGVHPDIHYTCLRGLGELIRENDWKITASVHLRDRDRPRIRAVEGGNTSSRNFGVAVDVGTTTIVAKLVDLKTGKIAAVKASHNSQARYGEDVISRMMFACKRGGLDTLVDAVGTTINSLVDAMVARAKISHQDITCFVAAGNTTMTHLLLGLSPCSIRVEPYVPTADHFPQLPAAEVGLRGHPRAVLHCLPCVSSYVGGDITAGVLACGMNDSPHMSALIDVGTNGEIVVGNSEWLVCCSASAGPAFEGGGTKCGMRAARGAVEKVRIQGDRVTFQTVEGEKPVGICGSGLIDLIAELFAEEIIDRSGKFLDLDHPRVQVTDETAEFVVADASLTGTGKPVVVTEDDIANLIKSKGAILAAMKVVLDSTGMTFQDLDNLFVAGGFGAHLDIEKAVMIGLLPDIPRDRIHFIGNGSLAGARLALLSSHAFHKAEAIARQMTYFELSVRPEFMNEFVAALFLPHTQLDLFPSVRESPARRKARGQGDGPYE